MDIVQLQNLLCLEEGPKLDFKRTLGINKTAQYGIKPEDWREFQKGQWDELIKDIISIANGNVGTANELGWLIIGASDELQSDGQRELFNFNSDLTSQQIMQRMDHSCSPRIPEITYEKIEIGGKSLGVIRIPPTPYLHETTRRLNTNKLDFDGEGKLVNVRDDSFYSEHTAFIRKGSHIFPASNMERRAIENDKKFDLVALEENLKYELVENLKVLLHKTNKGTIYSPGMHTQQFKEKYDLSFDGNLTIEAKELNHLKYGHIITSGVSSNITTQFLDSAIKSGKYLAYIPITGNYERTELLGYLQKLQDSLRRLKSMDEASNLADTVLKYKAHGGQIMVQCRDLIAGIARIDRIDDAISISVAILQFFDGDEKSLERCRLNNITPVSNEIEHLEAEALNTADILNWVRNENQQ